MKPLKPKLQLAKELKASNARERQIAKQYFQAGPSVLNLYNAFTHWYNSVPFLGGYDESGNEYVTGTPPVVGVKNLEKIYKVAKMAGELNKVVQKGVKTVQRTKVQPVIRTKIGDVEIDDPNLLYHLDNGDYRGWIDVDGAYIKDGMLYPGKTRAPGLLDYTAGKLLSGSAKEAKHIAKRTLKPTLASTKKFNTKDPNKVGAYYSAHPDEVTPITNNLDVKEVINFMNNHVGPKYYKLNGVHVGIDPNDIKLGYADLSGSNLGGYVGPSGEVVINKDILNNRDLLRYVLGHEIAGHWFDLHYPLTVPQMSTVGYGMPFKQDFLAERPWFNAIKEANAERRAFLLMTYFDKGVLGEDLDEAIKHMAKAEAKRYIDRLGYARGIDWQWPDILPFKQAATSVPAAGAGIYLAGNEEYKDGKLPGYSDGKIRIKPANRGKFNATKKRTGKTTEELTHSKNPLTRKRAIFAQNARKWKH